MSNCQVIIFFDKQESIIQGELGELEELDKQMAQPNDHWIFKLIKIS